jgi:RNA polymerase sigma factor (sigma-70 family)
MPPSDASILLNEFVTSGSDAAFAKIVAQHANMVYSAALRQVRRADLAEEVTQAVFILLLRKASQVTDGAGLSAWLHKVTRYTALNALKREARRRAHERRAGMMAETRRTESTWNDVSPILDEGIASLSRRDREAVILRFLDRRSFSDVGQTLGVSEQAAQMRVSRALEKLRSFFRRRGVIMGTATLGTAMRLNAVQAAPTDVRSLLDTAFTQPAGGVPLEMTDLAADTAHSMLMVTVRNYVLVVLLMLAAVIASGLLLNRLVTRPFNVPSSNPISGQREAMQPRSAPVLRLFAMTRATPDSSIEARHE